MTPPDELTRRAEEEVAKELGNPYVQTTEEEFGWCKYCGAEQEKPHEKDCAYALAVRLTRYKQGVERAEKKMHERVERYARHRDIEYGGAREILDIFLEHTQEEQ